MFLFKKKTKTKLQCEETWRRMNNRSSRHGKVSSLLTLHYAVEYFSRIYCRDPLRDEPSTLLDPRKNLEVSHGFLRFRPPFRITRPVHLPFCNLFLYFESDLHVASRCYLCFQQRERSFFLALPPEQRRQQLLESLDFGIGPVQRCQWPKSRLLRSGGRREGARGELDEPRGEPLELELVVG